VSRILVLILMISTYALASEAGHGETDIVQRTVNFLLFAGLIWYLVGEPAKNYFASRSQSISDELKKVQEKLNESIERKKKAEMKISDAKKFADDLVVTSKKENKIINDNIMAQCELDLETLTKQGLSSREYAQRKMVRDTIEDVLTETLSQSSDDLDKEAITNIILKKVA